jgi:ATP-dependent 26S proteasome regulatory subunit
MLISNLLVSKLGNVFQTDFTMSGSNIFKLLLLLSAGEIKNGVNSLLIQFINCIKNTPYFLLEMVMLLAKFIKRDTQLELENKADDEVKDNVISIDVEQNFLILVCNYILKNNNCSYKMSANDAIIKNIKDNVINVKLENVVINFDNYSLELVEQLVCGRDINTNEINSVKCNNINTITIKNYYDLLTTGQKNIVEQIYNEIRKLAGQKRKKTIDYVNSFLDLSIYEDANFTENSITKMILEKYPNFDRDDTFIKIMIIGSILLNYCGMGCIDKDYTNIKNENKSMFDKQNIYPSDKCKDVTRLRSNINSYALYIEQYITTLGIKSDTMKTEFKSFNVLKKDTTISSNTMLTFMITSPNQIDTQNTITEFVQTINSSYKKNSTKTKIHFIKLVEDITNNETTNPEYEEYIEKKKMVENSKVSENPSNLALFEFLNKPVPPKVIKTQTKVKNIKCKFLNEMEKDFSTLFLREEDKEELTNSLDMFKNNGHILQDLGLQNKFNLLLYGEPGTGKSTTIQAVANYLQKDIYYIDLQKVETNEDLHMIFEYVNKNIPNSGIIIMEDIDAMTDVILKRTDKVQEYKMNDIVNNQNSKLTLEYFLNILQGTLTMDNSVFIVTTNHIEHLDPAFYRDGRFDVKIELKLCNRFQIASIYKRMLNKDIPDELLNMIPENKFSPASIIYQVKKFIFNKDKDPKEIMSPFILSKKN